MGTDYTIGTPTQERTGLGKIVTIIGFTEDNRRVIVADKSDPTRTAEVKFSNIGYLVATDGTFVDMITGKPPEAQPTRKAVLHVLHHSVPAPSEPLATARRCMRKPIPEIFEAARLLDAAVTAHLLGRFDLADELIRAADMSAIRDWSESLWGPRSPYVQYRDLPHPLPHLPTEQRASLRNPTPDQKSALHSRDGHHCRFCGIPVIPAEIRKRIRERYPHALRWGRTNPEQHFAFQAMCAQYDHIVPWSRGGKTEVDNMVVTCWPCNCGRMEYSLEEVGLLDPRTRAPIRSTWDGLRRFH